MPHLFYPYQFLALLLCIAGLSMPLVSYADYKQSSIPYNFIDISDSGLGGDVLLEDCDECGRAIEVGFPFTYYGRVFSHMYVSSNGFVIPGPSTGENRLACCSGRGIPTVDDIDGVMSLWWVDLSMKAEALSEAVEENGKVFIKLTGSPGSQIFIIQFNQVRHFHNLATNTANTFQLQLFESDNHIEFHYKEIVANQNLHTIGIESPKEDEGFEYFRGTNQASLPEGGNTFALSFTPPEAVKLTGSFRYAVEESNIEHLFEIDQLIALIGDVDIDAFLSAGSMVESIDTGSATLVTTNPATINLPYKTFDTLSETGGTVFGDTIDFGLSGGDIFSLDSQTIFIEQSQVVTTAETSVSSVSVNFDQTLETFKSTANLADNSSKVANAIDIFLFFYTDRIQGFFTPYQLSEFSSGIDCGVPYIDQGDDYIYVYALCETGALANEVVLKRFDIETYIDDSITDIAIDLDSSETKHVFTGTITEQGLVVGHSNAYAYAKDDGSGLAKQDVYFKGEGITEQKLNTASGTLKSLAMDTSGKKIVYVIDNSVYFYDVDSGLQTQVTSDGVGSADISGDGSTIVFSSTSTVTGSNGDASLEIFQVSSLSPIPTNFEQLTNLSSGECKLPVISDEGKRIAVVCNADLLGLGNDFTDREAVFVIETTTTNPVTHLITNVSEKSTDISRVAISGNGATLMFEDEDKNNAFRLTGLNSFSSKVEFGASESSNSKNYPVPFVLPGDGKSGELYFYTILALLLAMGFRLSLGSKLLKAFKNKIK